MRSLGAGPALQGAPLLARSRRRRCPPPRAAPAAPSAGSKVLVARPRDYVEISDAFVDAFFLEKNELDPAGRQRLQRAAQRDLENRYGSGRGNRALLYVRGADGEVLGCVGVEPQPFVGDAILRGTARNNPPPSAELRPVVSNLSVAPAARRKGLAAALMRAAEDAAADWGYGEVVLLVEAGNTRAQALYRKLGYRQLPGGREADAPTLKVLAGALTDVRVVNLCFRKSLAPFPRGYLANSTPLQLAGTGGALVAALAAAANPEGTFGLLSALAQLGWDALPQ